MTLTSDLCKDKALSEIFCRLASGAQLSIETHLHTW